MDLRLRSKDRIRIVGDHEENNFIDVGGTDWDLAMTVDLYPAFHYIEIRKRDSSVRVFLFKKKGDKKEYDFGWYKDAEVIFALNEVLKK